MSSTNEACVMISLRDVRVANTSGHCVWVPANTPTTVPGPLVDTAAGLGCVPADTKVYEAHRKAQERAAEEEAARIERLVAACADMVNRNQINEFTASGYPKCDVLAKLAGVEETLVTESVRSRVFEIWKAKNRTPAIKPEEKKGK